MEMVVPFAGCAPGGPVGGKRQHGSCHHIGRIVRAVGDAIEGRYCGDRGGQERGLPAVVIPRFHGDEKGRDHVAGWKRGFAAKGGVEKFGGGIVFQISRPLVGRDRVSETERRRTCNRTVKLGGWGPLRNVDIRPRNLKSLLIIKIISKNSCPFAKYLVKLTIESPFI